MARVEVVMPQMGESITEGTITEWLKAVGDLVEVDEDIFTMATDKVDAEVPSPVRGILQEMRAQVGDTIPVGEVVAVLETDVDAVTAPAPAAPAPTPVVEAPAAAAPAVAAPVAAPVPPPPALPAVPPPPPAPAAVEATPATRATPVVRKIAAEYGIQDLSPIPGTGANGRITKKDILAWIEAGGAARAVPPPPPMPLSATVTAPVAAVPPPPALPAVPPPPAIPTAAADPLQSVPAAVRSAAAKVLAAAAAPPLPSFSGEFPAGWEPALIRTPKVHVYPNDRVVPMTRMEGVMADNMLQSRRVSAHCHTVWEVDVTKILQARKSLKGEYESQDVKLTLTPFFVSAVIEGLRRYPILNAAVDGRNIIYRGDMNIGVAVATDAGLIVPVLKNADTLNLLGIARGVNDLATRAQSSSLKPQDVSDGTFSVSNAGIWGALYGVPVLVQPQVGILGIGGIRKAVIADDDNNIRIRSVVNLVLSFDHRIIDGASADGFMRTIKDRLESWS